MATWLLLCMLIYLLQTENKYPEHVLCEVCSEYFQVFLVDTRSSFFIKYKIIAIKCVFQKGFCYHDFDTVVLFRYATFFAYLKMASFGHELINTLKKVTRDNCKMSNFIFPFGYVLRGFVYNFVQFQLFCLT